jgi:hypothetical protein
VLKRLTALVAMLALMASAGCSLLKQPTSWMYADESSVIFLSWTNASGTLEGTAQIVAAGDTTSTSGSPVTSTNAQLTGTESDGKISLRIGGSILGTSLGGTIDNSSLTLDIPSKTGGVSSDTFKPASAADFNSKVSELAVRIQEQRDANASARGQKELAAQVTALPQAEAGVQAAAAKLSAATAAASTAISNLGSLTSKAVSSGCSNSAASDKAIAAYETTTSAAYDLTSASQDQKLADSRLASILDRIKQLGGADAQTQNQISTDTAAVNAGEQAANSADALAARAQSAANETTTAVYSLKYC